MESPEQELYSVGEVAERLGLHVRTVRNYVRDGKLKAVRIGKQYRISRADFEALTSGPAPEETPGAGPPPGRVEVSAIVRIDGLGPAGADRLSTCLTAAAQSVRGTREPLRIQTVHDKERAGMKIVILGDAATTADVLHLIDGVLGPDNGLFTESGGSSGGTGAAHRA
ncbi:helix-turn-helix domain-containing protein [Streptomyces sp. NPDC059142]|uniref:helix-turn-helix domain-containing protein n=1 Tax=Streptomyces sp. NPDC059142 TaxID=3346739 RepID=UPI00369BAEED